MTRREQTSVSDHSTPDRAKLVTDAISQQLRDLAAVSGLFKDAIIFADIPVVSGMSFRLRHGFGRRANWLVIDWAATNISDPCKLTRDSVATDGENTLTMYPTATGTLSLVVF